MKRLAALALAASVMTVPACKESPSEPTRPEVTGTGALYQYGAGCTGWWILVADSGPSYQIADLEPEFEQQGLRVQFTVKERADHTANVCMVGAVVDILAMSKLQ